MFAGAMLVAPVFGRVALPCWHDGPLEMRSAIFCAANRNHMAPELLSAMQDSAAQLAQDDPGTTVAVLDAGFPFWDGFPLLPHLSHDDGEKVDLAFFYRDGPSPSPIGYFAFVDGPTDCGRSWPTMRWDMGWLAPLWPERPLDEARTARLVEILVADPRIGKVFIEPHLTDRMGLNDPKIRFQGCRAARHDDHIHVQL